ncbi:MAG: thioredoxin domain-containing protein [Rhizomicrobium sp.]
MSRNQVLIGIVVIALLALGAFAWFTMGRSDSDASATAAAGAPAAVATADDRTLGNPKAPIVAIEYAAPMCPHCAHLNEEGFPVLKKDYIDTGKVFYIFRVFPIGQPDIAAESIARCLPAGQYFAFIDLLFRNQAKWDPENGVQDVHGGLVAMGRIAGLGADQVDQCIANTDSQKRIMAVAQDASTRYGVSGTPTFVINGDVLPGGAPWTDVKAKIDAALAAKK